MKIKIYITLLFCTSILVVLFDGCNKPITPKAMPEPQPCADMPVVEYQGETYPTVQIGTQCWLAKNLNIGKQIGHIYESTDNDTIEKYCYFNQKKNCDLYGGLYKWDELMQYATEEGSRGICPPGWHVPTSDEFMELYFYVDGCPVYLFSNDTKLRFSGTENCEDCQGKSGFELLLGGRAYLDGDGDLEGGGLPFGRLTYAANMWTSSEAFVFFFYNEFSIISTEVPTSGAFSVRCIKDQ